MAYKQIRPIIVSEGGTGVTTMTTAYAPVCAGTTATGALQVASTGLGTSGFILTSTGGASLPTFQAPAASSITITGDSGGGLTGNSFTFTGGTTGLTFAGATSTETLGGTLIVANGGTGVATMTTAYAPVVAGTTATGALQVASTGLSTSGFVLTSNGASAVPSFKVVPNDVTWSVISANQTAVVNNGYFCNKAGTLALALPTTSAVGDIIEVANENTATGTQFTQASGQQILIGNTNTTSGATGTLTSSAVGDTLKLVCKTANTVWRVTSGWGNWTVV